MTLPSGLWAEGDSLSPTNLNRRNPVGTFPAKTYHVAWAAGTGTTQITNAIANAAAGGYTAVFIDASRLPYDASAVTFNNAVHMIREGGPTSSFIGDIMAYGASGISSDDAYYAGVAAIGGLSNGGELLFPAPFHFRFSRPLITTKQLWIHGTHRTGSQVSRSYYAGQTIVINGSGATAIPIGTALATGSGGAWVTTTDTQTRNYWLDLRESPTLDIDGLAAFTVRCFVKPADVTRTSDNIVISKGTIVGRSTTSAFRLSIQSGVVFFLLNHGGTTTTISGGSLANATVYHLEATYDGTTMRLFVDGTSVATAAATGTVSQGAVEQVTFGPDNALYDSGPSSFTGFLGSVDSLEIANTARHTANFTKPTAKHAKDSNTLMLLNWDLQDGGMVRGETKNGNAWLIFRPMDGQVAYARVTDLLFQSGGGIAACSPHFEAARLWLADCRHGIYMGLRSYFSHLHDLDFLGQNLNRYNIILSSGSGISHFYDMAVAGGVIPIIINGSSVTLDAVYVVADSRTLVGYYINEGQVCATGCTISTEAIVSTVYQGGITLQTDSIHWVGGALETINSAPFIIGNNLSDSDFRGARFTTAGPPPSIYEHHGVMSSPLLFDKCNQYGTWVPWSDVAGTAVVGKIGKGTAITFSATPTFDCSLRDKFELGTLTSNVTGSTITHVTPGQELSFKFQQNAVGGFTVNQPSNVTGVWAVSSNSSAWTLLTGEVALDSNTYITSVVSGP